MVPKKITMCVRQDSYLNTNTVAIFTWEKNPGRNVLLNSYMFLYLRTFMTYNTNFKSIFLNFYNFNMFISRNAIYF